MICQSHLSHPNTFTFHQHKDLIMVCWIYYYYYFVMSRASPCMTRRHKYLYLELIVSKTTYTYIHKHNAHNVHVTNRKKIWNGILHNAHTHTHTHTHTTNSLIGRYMMYHIISPFDAEHFCLLIVLHHIQYRTTVDWFFVCWTPTIMARHALWW